MNVDASPTDCPGGSADSGAARLSDRQAASTWIRLIRLAPDGGFGHHGVVQSVVRHRVDHSTGWDRHAADADHAALVAVVTGAPLAGMAHEHVIGRRTSLSGSNFFAYLMAVSLRRRRGI